MTEKSAYYIVSYAWHQSYFPIFVKGPKIDDFPSLCNSLKDEAVNRALQKAKRVSKNDNGEVEIHLEYIGMQDIHECILELLFERGFEEAEDITEVIMWGSSIFTNNSSEKEKENFTKDQFSRIVYHNNFVGQEIDKDCST